MRFGRRYIRHWFALAVIAWGTLMCCCPAANASTKKSASCCEKISTPHCPTSQDGTKTCGFIELRQSLAPVPAADQIHAPQLCFVAEILTTSAVQLTREVLDAPTFAPPPPQTLLALHCSLLC